MEENTWDDRKAASEAAIRLYNKPKELEFQRETGKAFLHSKSTPGTCRCGTTLCGFPVPAGARNSSRYVPDTSLSRNSYSYITNRLYVYSQDEIIRRTGISCLLSGNLQTPQRKYDFTLELAFNNDVVLGTMLDKMKGRWYRVLITSLKIHEYVRCNHKAKNAVDLYSSWNRLTVYIQYILLAYFSYTYLCSNEKNRKHENVIGDVVDVSDSQSWTWKGAAIRKTDKKREREKMRSDRDESSSIWFRIGAKNISEIPLGSNQVCRQRVENKQRHAINIASHSEGNLTFDFFASWQPVIAADDLRAEFPLLRFVPLVSEYHH